MNALQSDRCDIESVPLNQLSPINELIDEDSDSHHSESVVLLPLIVCNLTGNDRPYTIIDGYKRFVMLKEQNASTVSCVLVRAGSLTEAGKLRIELNCSRPIPFKEKFKYLKWAKSHCEEMDYQAVAQRLSVLGKDLRDFEQLFQSSPAIIDAVIKGILDSTLFTEVQFLSHDDIAAIITLFSKFTFTRQMQRELLEWLPELVYRNKKSISELLAVEFIKNIIDDRKLNDPQKIKKIRDYFYEMRFPTLSDAKKEWQALVSATNPSPSKVSFNPSEAFEKNVLEIKIRINDAAEAQTLLTKMAEIPEEHWESLIYPALLFRAKQEKKR